MAYLFGWQASDLGPTTTGNIANPNQIAKYDVEGGFAVLQDCIVERVFIHTVNNDSRPFRIYIYDFLSGALLAQSQEHYSQAGGLFVTMPQLSLSQGSVVSIAFHSNTFIQSNRETLNFRFFERADRAYEDGPINPYAGTSSANGGRREIWADGTIGATAPSITAADDITTEGQTATFILSGNSAAPVSATLNGTDVGTLTDQGSGAYSFSAPLIADDDTADLVVSVDSATVSTEISYANSYDRDQLTHPATEAEYSENSLSYPNAYATTQPYEWKVIADANASVVTIDWNALEADDGFHKDVASYATPVANGSTTVTLGVFVPETGQAYQFDRTITVSDGSVVVSSEDGAVGAALTPAISDAIEDAIA